VEYLGVIDMAKKEEIAKRITDHANAIIEEKKSEPVPVWAQVLPYDEAGKILEGGVPPYIPKGQELRVVKLTPEDKGCPCGGTHVKDVTDIVSIEVTKIIKKGKNTRVSYTCKV
jgi:Ser-tRNA(Ala) deacylase AlaX